MDVNFSQYVAKVEQGTRYAANSSLVVAGLARDIGDKVEAQRNNIECLGEKFRDYRVVIVENDSVDDTKDNLADWTRDNERVTVISEDVGDKSWGEEKTKLRAHKMAQYRNKYMDYISQELYNWSYLLVLDLDLTFWSFAGVFHSISFPIWDAMFANGMQTCPLTGSDVYYDTWVTKYIDGTTPGYHPQFNKFSPPMLVRSAFGGMGLYKLPMVMRFRYNGLVSGLNECYPDHVGLHVLMSLNGYDRLFINPGMITRRK